MNGFFKRLTIVVFCGVGVAFAKPSLAADIYVAPGGNDRNPGSREKPFATEEAARRKARGVRGAVTVFLRGGTYFLSKPVVLGPED